MNVLARVYNYFREHFPIDALSEAALDRVNKTHSASQFDPSGELALNSLRRGKAHFFRPGRLANKLNRTLALPLLEAALGGDGIAQQLYAEHRFINPNSLPAWARREVRMIAARQGRAFDLYDHTLLKLRNTDKLKRIRTRISATKPKQSKDVKPIPVNDKFNLALYSLCSYTSALKLNDRLKNLSDRKAAFRVLKTTEEGELVSRCTYFNPAEESPLGAHARKTLKLCVDFMFRAQVVWDMSKSYGLKLSVKSCIWLANRGTGWQMLDMELVDRVINAQNWLAREHPRLSTREVQKLLEATIEYTDIIGRLSTMLREDSLAPTSSSTSTQIATSKESSKVALRSAGSWKKSTIRSFENAIKLQDPNNPEARALAVVIFRCTRRIEDISNAAVVQEILSGRPLEEIIKALKSRIAESDKAFTMKEELSEVELERDDLSKKSRGYRICYLEENGKSSARDWLLGLDKSLRERVVARLIRAANGDLGVFKQIRPGLLQLRVEVGKGIRLYTTLPKKNEVIFLAGGDKATQDRDILISEQMIEGLKARKFKTAPFS